MHPAAPSPQLPHRPFPAVQYTWVADGQSATRITMSIVRASLWNKPMWVLYALLALLLALQIGISPLAGVFLLAFLAVFSSLVCALLVAYYWRGVRAVTAPGTIWATGYGPNGFVLIGAIATSVYDYAALASVRKAGAIVICRFKGDVMYEVVPAEIVPEREFEMLRQAVKKKKK